MTAGQLSLTGEEFQAHRWHEWRDVKLIDGRVIKLRSVLVQDEIQLRQMGLALVNAPVMAYDSETSGLFTWLGARIVGHALATWTGPEEITAWYVPVRHCGPDVYAERQLPVETVVSSIKYVLQTSGMCGLHHAKFDWQQLRADDVIPTRDFRDTSLEAVIANENEYNFQLKRLGQLYVTESAKEGLNETEDFMRADAKTLGMLYRKRRSRTGSDDEGAEEDTIEEVTYLDRFGHARVPIRLEGLYACFDVFLTLMLMRNYEWVLQRYRRVYDRERAIERELHDMEWFGLPANGDAIREMHSVTREEINYWLAVVRHLTGIASWEASDEEMKILFYTTWGYEAPKKTKKQEPSVDKEARGILMRKYPERAPLLIAINKLQRARKIHSTYAASFLRFLTPGGRIHPSYNQLEGRDEGGFPVTGRLSSSDPNIQNIAKKPIHLYNCCCRECAKERNEDKALDSLLPPIVEGGPKRIYSVRRYFTVPPGFIRAYIDYSQIELRVLAWFSQDPRLLECYRDNLDVHEMVANSITGGDRDIAKQVNFGNCLPADTMIITRRGAIPIQEVVVGDFVWTHRKRWQLVSGKKSQRRSTLVEMRTRTGRVLRSTPEHMWLVQFPSANGKPAGSGWVEARDADVGRYLVYHGASYGRNLRFVQKDLTRALGWIISEGSFDENVGLRVGQDRVANPAVVKEMRPVLERLGFRTWPEGSMQRWGLPRAKALELFGPWIDLHAKSAQKQLPVDVLDWAEESRCWLVAALWEGDGSSRLTKKLRRQVSYASISKALRQQLVRLLDSIGICAVDRGKQVAVCGSESLARFLSIIPSVKAVELRRHTPKKQFVAQERIVSVRRVDLAGEIEVFDLSVEEDHSFVADGVVSHNSYGMTEIGLGRRLTWKDPSSCRTPGCAHSPESKMCTGRKMRYIDNPELAVEKAKKILYDYFQWLAGVPRFRMSLALQMRKHGCQFENPFGRPRRIPELAYSEEQWRSKGERKMMSSIISGTSADLMKEGLIRCAAYLRPRDAGRCVQSVHDELVFDLRHQPGWTTHLRSLVHLMTDFPEFPARGVPILVSISLATTNWEDKKEIELLPDGNFKWK